MRQAEVEQLTLFEVGPDMAKIRRFLADMKHATRSKSTVRAYDWDWQSFEKWCAKTGRCSLPANPETVALYVAARLSDPDVAVSTIQRQLAAIAFKHKAADQPVPDRKEARAVLNGVRRDRKEAPRQRAALTPEQLHKICKKLASRAAKGSILAARNRAVMTLGFATGLRRSNLSSLNLCDVEFVRRKGLILHIRSSKTDQEGQGQKLWVLRGYRDVTCPVRALQSWIDVRGSQDGPLFFAVEGRSRWGGEQLHHRRMHHEAVNQVVKACVSMIGVSPDNYGGHSLRAGFVTTSLFQGASPLAVMEYTGHHTVDMVGRYKRQVRAFPAHSPLGRAI